MNKLLAKKLGFVLLLVAAQMLGLYVALKPETAKADDKPFITAEQMAAKDAAVTQCVMEQRVPVMGFGLKVVCLKPEGSVAWIR